MYRFEVACLLAIVRTIGARLKAEERDPVALYQRTLSRRDMRLLMKPARPKVF